MSSTNLRDKHSYADYFILTSMYTRMWYVVTKQYTTNLHVVTIEI
jgi:hypothetical protein